eukprot:TRINITY_DN3502_c0_g1_i2.p2 TRINITY_DN3502_c0_g1~~TRINITY_DN3502_c0_g1_i2.p2  ORF type:complete len:139 (+),score=20.88 TRINITY_DN3502_c0_g1_i2:506-922(+)
MSGFLTEHNNPPPPSWDNKNGVVSHCMWSIWAVFLEPTNSSAISRRHEESCRGAEKKELWSVSSVRTLLGGHALIIPSCKSTARTLSCKVFMNTLGTCMNSSDLPSNLAAFMAMIGAALKVSSASVASCHFSPYQRMI